MSKLADHALPLDCLYRWERTAPAVTSLSQPMGGGVVQDFSWAEIADQARRIAAHLKSYGWEPGSRIAILSANCAWWMISDVAIWMAGHVSVPLYSTAGPETIRQILIHSEARACFVGKLLAWETTQAGLPDGLPCISFPVAPEPARQRYPGWDSICAGHAPLPGEPGRRADELATLVYTSGTTGVPKGVMHSFGNIAWAVEAGAARFPGGAADRLLSHLPLAHVAERLMVECAWLFYGVHVYFVEKLETFGTDMQRARPTRFFTVPRLWQKFQQGVHEKLPPPRLRLLLRLPIVGRIVRRKLLAALGLDQCHAAGAGAAPMPVALLAWYAELGLPIIEGVGMTENFGVSHTTLPGKTWHGSVGVPQQGVQARIDAATGELQLLSPANMLGYYKEPELTRQAFTEDGWLRTGDKGRIDEQGRLYLTGRLKDLFKTSKGKYVAPAPIEDRLLAHPALEACVVSGASLAQPLGLAMLSPAGLAAEPAALGAQLAQHLEAVNAGLESHERLACLVLVRTPWSVDNGLVTPTLKIKRNRIDDVYGPRFEGWVGRNELIVWGD